MELVSRNVGGEYANLTSKGSDDLHAKFVQLGRDRHRLTHMLLYLLPKIYAQKIYLGYAKSIFEYGNKFGGLSDLVICKALKLHQELFDRPHLKRLVAMVGVHKVSLVQTLVTPENELEWVSRLKTMNTAALQVLAKEIRKGRQEPKLTIALSGESVRRFLAAKAKFPNHWSNQKFLMNLLTNGKFYAENFDDQVSFVDDANADADQLHDAETLVTRHIPMAIKRKLPLLCQYPGCNKRRDNFHHRVRFADSPNHSSLVSLCRSHHEFMHQGLIANEMDVPREWKLNLANSMQNKSYTDYMYLKFKGAG